MEMLTSMEIGEKRVIELADDEIPIRVELMRWLRDELVPLLYPGPGHVWLRRLGDTAEDMRRGRPAGPWTIRVVRCL